MMRKNEILTAAVNINRFAEISSYHSGALNVPAGSSVAPRRLPIRLPGLCVLPKSKIHRLLFQFADIDSSASFKILERLMRKLAVFMEFFRAEIHVTVNGISIAFFNQSRNNRNNFINIFCGFRVIARFTDIHALCVFPELLNIFFGDFLKGKTFFVCTADNFIVDIGKILNKGNLIASVFKIAAKNIENAKRTGITDMDKIIYRRTAGVNFEFARRYRNQFLLFSC